MILTASACGGGGGSSNDTKKNEKPAVSTGSSAPDKKGEFTAEPVRLKDDPCTLITKAEAEALIGPVNEPANSNGTCVYVSSQSTGGQLAVTVNGLTCKLLFLALDKNFFGGDQVRRDDVGDGGMLVKGNGNVQFVVNGGCVEVAANLDNDTKVDDETMVQLARTAAGRVS